MQQMTVQAAAVAVGAAALLGLMVGLAAAGLGMLVRSIRKLLAIGKTAAGMFRTRLRSRLR